MLDPDILAAYNAVRQCVNKDIFCHAPFTSINFEQSGNATVCCYNRTHVLGTYPKDSVADIWHGAKADQLRTFLRRNVLPSGCQICTDQFDSRNFGGLRARFYDQLADTGYPDRAPWPKVMEFETSNICNLECTMCNGYFSSSIRKHREHRPPIKSPYDAEFVRQLEPFIPHLTTARFLGGEPFLIKFYYEIWDLIARVNPDIDVTIVTNGTILDDKVKAILERLRARVNISIDALDPANYERIRVNAKFDAVMANFRYFREYVRRKNTSMTFNVCPMKSNWRELPRFLEFCNAHDILLFFNTVLHPEELSLRTMSRPELGAVIEFLRSADIPDRTPAERFNKADYLDLIHQLESFQADAFQDYDDHRFDEEDLTMTDWNLRVADGNVASLELSDREPGSVRIPIDRAERAVPWDIQANKTNVSIRADHRYALSFRARADRPRSITFGVSQAHEPWQGLGLYKNVDLTSEWKTFEAALIPTADEDNARIHFDLGDSAIAVELATIRLRSRLIETQP